MCTASTSTNDVDEQGRGDALDFRDPVAREHAHQDQPDRPVDHVLDEIAAAVALAPQQRRRRGGAVDHHRAEREQAQRGGEQDAVLQRLAPLRSHARQARLGVPFPFRVPHRDRALCGRRHSALTSTPADRSLLSLDELTKALSAGFEVGELVEARAGRRQQHHLPTPQPLPAPGDSSLETRHIRAPGRPRPSAPR